MHPEQVIIEQLVTEKAVGARVLSRYVFKVHVQATKVDVASAVRKLFKVKVKDVNTCQVKSKRRMRGRFAGRTPGWKKAYVSLVPGEKIEEIEI